MRPGAKVSEYPVCKDLPGTSSCAIAAVASTRLPLAARSLQQSHPLPYCTTSADATSFAFEIDFATKTTLNEVCTDSDGAFDSHPHFDKGYDMLQRTSSQLEAILRLAGQRKLRAVT